MTVRFCLIVYRRRVLVKHVGHLLNLPVYIVDIFLNMCRFGEFVTKAKWAAVVIGLLHGKTPLL